MSRRHDGRAVTDRAPEDVPVELLRASARRRLLEGTDMEDMRADDLDARHRRADRSRINASAAHRTAKAAKARRRKKGKR
jgi:hypothetical protein